MFSKPLSQIEEEDIQNLADNQEKESGILEYKQEISGNEKEKKELAKDISALANTSGGYLIIGIEEVDGKASKLTGTTKQIGRQPSEEWVESILLSNVRPKIGVKMKVIQLSSDAEKIIIVIHIPLSTHRPHMVIADGKNAYYRRHNYQSNYADEHEVRSMFLESKTSEDQTKDFLSKRNLDNAQNGLFALNPMSLELSDSLRKMKELPDDFGGNPFILFSSCPKYLEERVDIASSDFRTWLDANNQIQFKGLGIDFLNYEKQISSESIKSCFRTNDSDIKNRLLTRYVDIFRNGYVENGVAPEMIWTGREIGLMLQLAHFTASFWIYIKFIKLFYEKIGYIDEISIIVSLADVKGITLHGFGKKNETTNWTNPYERSFRLETLPTASDKNIRIERSVLVSELNDEYIEEIVKEVSKRVSNAFGESMSKCFDDYGNFDENQLRGFRNVR